ncbi:MAG: Ribosomal RNA large subunit methyltransferase L [Syntrophus sp. PtaU1.Bin005]|jgi:putative N6-adenine-specific DNA methylase|uniref:THUMP domain-containing class I SAM-dependent RNA methyltransferase n=1 Tax=Syntrophus buswellii TaxID=43774 RepID=UPI0009C7E19D|nr:MAG: Ribosomal RNA large subunit methyltransferase L [Syntrophus sp. PtaB.Bin138]OPY81384.1 MAG: Ribosomal RNA large subunit methyltransferase L [Syntrophus sp. PtaU1.Bin005]
MTSRHFPLWRKSSRILVTCPKGIASYLKSEIESLGFPIELEREAAIVTEGTLGDTLRLNLSLRTGHRVLYLMAEGEAGGPDDLYRWLHGLAWENVLHEDGYLCVTSTVDHPSIRDTRFANQKCKDAIVDRLQKTCGRRPDSGPARDRAVVHLFWKGQRVQIYLDTSGEPLSRRGYRKIPVKAPMQETLAAAIVLATGWSGKGAFVNPMCGSGTIAIEAALIALNRAPGLLRSNFGFRHLKGFPAAAWKELRKKAQEKSVRHFPGQIIATDMDRRAIAATEQNAANASVQNWIHLAVCDYSETDIPPEGGIVVMNPPYGERLGNVQKLERTYAGLGSFLKTSCSGYRGFIFTGNVELAKNVGLKTRRRMIFFNSGIECRLLEYELYEGTYRDWKTASKQEGTNGPRS